MYSYSIIFKCYARLQGVQKVSPNFILITIVSLNKFYCMINEINKHNKNH